MASRPYNSETRRQRQAELRARIAAAAAELHAAKGALATSYADIAQHAGVSLPTVYSHFPTLDDLIGACTGHVGSQAPPLEVDALLAAPELATAAELLAAGMDKLNAYFEPWQAWREHQLVPRLADLQARVRQQQTALIKSLLARHLGPGDHREAAAAWEAIVAFEFWHRLVRQHKLSRAAARRIVHRLLLAVAGPQPAAPSKPRPRSKPLAT